MSMLMLRSSVPEEGTSSTSAIGEIKATVHWARPVYNKRRQKSIDKDYYKEKEAVLTDDSIREGSKKLATHRVLLGASGLSVFQV